MNHFQIERRLRRIALPHLMRTVVFGQAIVYVLAMLWPSSLGYGLFSSLSLSRAGLARLELWRLVTFLFVPPNTSALFVLFSLYFYYLIGTELERHWGAYRFTLFYLLGALGAILACLLTGYASNTYLNLSVFLAYASIWPEEQVLLMMVLPVKMKVLALLDVALFLLNFVRGGASTRVTIVLCLLNVFLFVGGNLLHTFRNEARYWKTRRNFRRTMWR